MRLRLCDDAGMVSQAGHRWNGVEGHDCVDCPPVSIWKCDIRAHGGPRTDEHGRLLSTPAEQLRWAAEEANRLVAAPLTDEAESSAAGRRLHARIFGLSDRMPDGAELDNLILAIEAEAAALPAAPAELDRNAVADALNRAWLRSTDAQFGGGRDIDLIYMDGYLAGRDAPDWRDDDHVLRLAERYAAAYAEGEPE